MQVSPSRRALLATVATASTAGCIDVFGDQGGCDLEHGTWRGAAESIATAVAVGEQETAERVAALAAAEAAFARLDARLAIELDEQRWINPGVSHSEQYDAYVRVREIRDRDGTVSLCPDSAFDVEEARSALPERVTVTVTRSGETEDRREYGHEIELVSSPEGLD